jgi:hypothetical protein
VRATSRHKRNLSAVGHHPQDVRCRHRHPAAPDARHHRPQEDDLRPVVVLHLVGDRHLAADRLPVAGRRPVVVHRLVGGLRQGALQATDEIPVAARSAAAVGSPA